MSDLSSPHPSSNRRILRFALVGAGMLLQPCWIFAGGSGLSGLAEAEVQRRQTLIQDATGRIQEGHLLLEHEKFAEAVTAFSEAYSSLPEAPLTESARDAAREGFAAASVARARELAKEARYAEANQLLDAVLAPGMYPGYEAAVEFRKQLADPDRYPPALTPQHIEATQQVTHWLTMAQSHFELGDYDAANQDYLKVLRIDPTNTAARRGMEVVEQKKAEYYASARDQTRATMLNQVNRKWEDGIPPDLATTTALEQGRIASLKTEETRRDLLVQKLRTLVIPSVDFQGASLEEIMEFLRVRSRDVDPEGRGVDFILDVPLEIASRPIDLNVSNIPMDQLVRYIAEQAGARYRVEPFAVKITSLSEQSSEILTKRYKVPPNFIETSATDDAATSGNVDPFATNTTPAGGLTIRRLSAKEFLEGRGVTFPDGSGASYTAVTNQLIVRNTAANLEIVDMLVEQAAAASPKQARITVRMVEVDQTNMQEMGFDWLMGAFNVPGSDALYMSGGTAGNAEASGSPTENFPMSYPGGTGVAVGVNPMTAGLRSSGEIVGRPKLNDLLGENISPPVVNSRSPGTFALTGMLTDPQFQMVIRSLNQRKG
ncbi:MAG: tetratricopeptide repeat protein, partial [Verrucomicrobiales bacterium]|nr:tetratricopeptide repeat protein [Verrucomicrobiales bacterium]